MKQIIRFLWLVITIIITSCGELDKNNLTEIDITGKELTNRSEKCTDYINTYTSTVKDINRNKDFYGEFSISASDGKCVFTSNSIPNHNFNDGENKFANKTKKVTETFEITKTPVLANITTSLSLKRDNAIMLNGVKLDLLAAACYGVGNEPLGSEKIGCNDNWNDKAWRYDPMSPTNNFGTDTHNAHTQPDGAYHYHGNPNALFDQSNPTAESPTIGFAADGFPIYGSYISDNGTIRKVISSYRLKSGNRNALGSEEAGDFPGGSYDGQFRNDYEYVEASGDLDECNGMTHNGTYGYYVTDSFPWVLNCFKGTPDTSFDKH